MVGTYSLDEACQALKGSPWVGSYSADQQVRLLKGTLGGSYSVDMWVSLFKGARHGSFFCRWSCQALKGPPWVGTYTLRWVRQARKREHPGDLLYSHGSVT